MVSHWLKMTWRSLITHPLFSAITILSLTVGCCGALLAGANAVHHLSYDRWVEKAGRVYAVAELPAPRIVAGENVQSSSRLEAAPGQRPRTLVRLPLKEAVADRIAGLEAQARLVQGPPLILEEQRAMERQSKVREGVEAFSAFGGTAYVDPAYFQIVDLDFLEGSADAIDDPDSIILVASRAEELFSGPAVGQTLAGIQDRVLTVIGVVRDPPKSSHVSFGSLASIRTYESVREKEIPATQSTGGFRLPLWREEFRGVHYLLRTPATEAAAFESSALAAIQAAAEIAENRARAEAPQLSVLWTRATYALLPLLDLHFGADGQRDRTADFWMVVTITVGALALLVLAAFNYVTLSLARALPRRREVAVAKALGAGRTSLIQQFMLESAIKTAIAIALGFALALFLRPWFARLVGQPDASFDLFEPTFLAAGLAGFLLLALAVGAYPAFVLASARPRIGLQESSSLPAGSISRAVTVVLLGLQIVSASVFTIIAVVVLAQVRHIGAVSPGFDLDNRYQVTISCPVDGRMDLRQRSSLLNRCRSTLREVLLKTPGIESSGFYSGPIFTTNSIFTAGFGRSRAGEEIGKSTILNVDPDFLVTMGVQPVAGRLFDSDSSFDRQVFDTVSSATGAGAQQSFGRIPVIVTRAWLPLLGVDNPSEAIGAQIAPKDRATSPYEIVGVVEDWEVRPLRHVPIPVVFVPSPGTAAVALSPDPSIAQRLRDTLEFVPSVPGATLNISSLRDLREQAYRADHDLLRAVSTLALVSIGLAAFGVFGLASFEIRRRYKEIGIRKALGASPGMIYRDMMTRPVVIALATSILSWPIGLWLANSWLEEFVYRTSMAGYAPVLASTAVALLVSAAVFLAASRAAHMKATHVMSATP